jgi:hypothetical protein
MPERILLEGRFRLKPHVRCFSIIAGCMLLLGAFGCKSNLPELVGTYSVNENGRLAEFIRVLQDGNKFYISEKDGLKWLSPVEVSSVDEDDLERILSRPITANINALGTYGMAVVQVRRGWKLGSFECKTGFWLASSLGPVELHKTSGRGGKLGSTQTPLEPDSSPREPQDISNLRPPISR